VKANNLFGIKAGKSWKGLVYNIKTREFDAVKGWYVIMAPFRQYATWLECINDYASIIERLSWYKDAAENCHDPIKYLDGILPTSREPGWATDPRYREKVLSIANKFGWLNQPSGCQCASPYDCIADNKPECK
jgi:flagellar protein FlgJ